MKKIKKIFIFACLFFCTILGNINTYAKENTSQNITVNFKDFNINTKYSEDSFRLQWQEDTKFKTGSFPTSSVGVNYAATVCISVSSAASSGINLELVIAGYSVSSTQIYRKYAEGSYTISC